MIKVRLKPNFRRSPAEERRRSTSSEDLCLCVCVCAGLTADLQEERLLVLADGVASAADVASRVGELDVLQGERGDAGVAADHDVPVQALQQRSRKKLQLLTEPREESPQ